MDKYKDILVSKRFKNSNLFILSCNPCLLQQATRKTFYNQNVRMSAREGIEPKL